MDIKEITHRVEKGSLVIRQITAEIEKIIVGQTELLNRMLIGLLCNETGIFSICKYRNC